MLLLEAKFKRKSSKHVTKSIEGQESMQRSESRSFGPGNKKKKDIRTADLIFAILLNAQLAIQSRPLRKEEKIKNEV